MIAVSFFYYYYYFSLGSLFATTLNFIPKNLDLEAECIRLALSNQSIIEDISGQIPENCVCCIHSFIFISDTERNDAITDCLVVLDIYVYVINVGSIPRL